MNFLVSVILRAPWFERLAVQREGFFFGVLLGYLGKGQLFGLWQPTGLQFWYLGQPFGLRQPTGLRSFRVPFGRIAGLIFFLRPLRPFLS